MELIWFLIETAVNLFECFIMVEFPTRFLQTRLQGWKQRTAFLITWAALVLEITVVNSLVSFEGFAIVIPVLILFVYSLLCLKGNVFQKLLASVFVMVLIMIIASLTLMFVSYFSGNSVEHVTASQDTARLAVLIISKLFLFYATRMILKQKQKGKELLTPAEWISILIIPIISIFTIVFVMDIAVFRPEGGPNFIFMLFSILGIVFTNAITYYLFIRISKDNEVKRKYELLSQQTEYQHKNMEDVRDLYQFISTLRHDLKNHLTCAVLLIDHGKPEEAAAYLQKILKQEVDTTQRLVFTGNEFADCILNVRISQCRTLGIQTDVSVTCPIQGIEDRHISVLFGNLLDNAIEACSQAAEKKIRLCISQEGGYLSICLSNSTLGGVLANNKELKTTKKEKGLHGFGVRSIRKIAAQYGGLVDFYEQDDLFTCRVMLKIQPTTPKFCQSRQSN